MVHLISGDLWAGAEVATYHLVNELARSIHVDVLALNEGELVRRLRRDGKVDALVADESRTSLFELSRVVRRHCRHADIVHAHRYKENILAALSGKRWISTQHGRPEPATGWKTTLRRDVTHWLDMTLKRHSAKRVIAVSRDVQEWLTTSERQPRAVFVPNGIPDPIGEAPLRPWIGRPLRVGVLARLFPVKGLTLAIDALAEARREIVLEILGDGPERAALERRAADRGCADRVRFVGHVANPLKYVQEWRAMLVTSMHEGNPISVLESLALATPVLSVALRGIEEILAGQGGVLIPHRDPSGWAASIDAMIGDEPNGTRLSLEARRRFEAAWRVQLSAEAILRVYQEIQTAI